MPKTTFVIVLLLAACELPFEPQVALTGFETWHNAAADVDAKASGDEVHVTGVFVAPCTPVHIEPDVQVDFREIILEIHGDRGTGCPQTVLDQIGYRASIGQLSPGPWRIRVRHRWLDRPWQYVHDEIILAH